MFSLVTNHTIHSARRPQSAEDSRSNRAYRRVCPIVETSAAHRDRLTTSESCPTMLVTVSRQRRGGPLSARNRERCPHGQGAALSLPGCTHHKVKTNPTSYVSPQGTKWENTQVTIPSPGPFCAWHKVKLSPFKNLSVNSHRPSPLLEF